MGGKRKITMTSTSAGDGGEGPFVVYFPSGACPKEIASGKKKMTAYRNTAQYKTGQRTVVAETDGVNYVGSSFGASATPLPCKYAVGVMNEDTGKLKLMPIATGRLIRMEARAHGMDYGAPDYEEQEQTAADRRALQKRLVNTFGSTKKQRADVKEERAMVGADNIAGGGALEGMISKAAEGELTAEEIAAKSQANRNIPPHDPAAKTPEQAYPLSKIMPDSEFGGLHWKPLLRAAEDKEGAEGLRQSGRYCELVLGCLHHLKDKSEQVAKRRAKCLALLQHTIRLYQDRPVLKQKRGGLEEMSKALLMSADVLEALLGRFYERREEWAEGDDGGFARVVYERSERNKELLLGHVLVLALTVEGYELDPADLCKELKLTPQVMAPRFRELGCKVDTVRAMGAEARRVMVRLLPVGRGEATTLQENFPKPKVGRAT